MLSKDSAFVKLSNALMTSLEIADILLLSGIKEKDVQPTSLRTEEIVGIVIGCALGVVIVTILLLFVSVSIHRKKIK